MAKEKNRMRYLRILAIEDDEERLAIFNTWLSVYSSEDLAIRLVCAQSAGQAMGVIARDSGRTFAGLMLDHDLEKNVKASTDLQLSGSDLISKILISIKRDVPILVHSMNLQMGPEMAKRLEKAGYNVTYVPFKDLNAEKFNDWFEYVKDLWDDFCEDE